VNAMITKKIHFQLEIDSGFPPIGVETLNARECDDGTFEILNTPFFVKNTAYGDIINAKLSPDRRLEFADCLKQSDYKAISVILLNSDMRARLIDDFQGSECVIEYGEFPGYQMLAIAVPGTADYVYLRGVLDTYEAEGRLSFAELVA
jgi:hypothetical protein